MNNNEPVGKAYIVVDENHYREGPSGTKSLGLSIAGFDSLEEAREFVMKENNPNLAIFGPVPNA